MNELDLMGCFLTWVIQPFKIKGANLPNRGILEISVMKPL